MDRKPEPWSTPLAKVLNLALGTLVALLLLGAAELAARAWVDRTDLDRILDMLQRDATLFWRNRADRDTRFYDSAVLTDGSGIRRPATDAPIGPKRPGTLRVVCMGESPTFGWGVAYEDAYPARLEALLRAEAGLDVEVINAGMIGHSSHQGRLLLEREILALQPDLVTIPYAINDVDRYRFFRSNGESDRSLEPESPRAVAFGDLAGRSRFLAWLSRRARDAFGGSAYFNGRPVGMLRPRAVRVPPEDYADNLAAIARLAREHGGAVAFLAMPINLPTGGPRDPQNEREAASLVADAARKVEDQDDCAGAAPLLERAARLDPDTGDAAYYQGVCLRRTGDVPGATAAFARSFEGEARRCGRAGLAYNGHMARIAGDLGVPFIDLAGALDRIGRDGLFLTERRDPIHPSEAGHAAIARLVYEGLRQAGWPRRD